MENEVLVVWLLITGFVGLVIGMAVTAAFYELCKLIDRRDDYDETL